MIIVSQAPVPLANEGDDIAVSTRAAVATGFELVSLPTALMYVHEVEPALAGQLVRARATPAVWIGTIPDEAVYRAVDAGLRARGACLINDPEAHLDVFEFDRAYVHLADLTARTVVVTAVDQVAAAVAEVGPPVFLKAALLSRKSSGWAATDADEVAIGRGDREQAEVAVLGGSTTVAIATTVQIVSRSSSRVWAAIPEAEGASQLEGVDAGFHDLMDLEIGPVERRPSSFLDRPRPCGPLASNGDARLVPSRADGKGDSQQDLEGRDYGQDQGGSRAGFCPWPQVHPRRHLRGDEGDRRFPRQTPG